ncbi:hypothetical protein FLLO111716_08275 [Flavobacterium longum]|uniref:hypothetical protein n=1 Tax=Flavobacterium longum TaxID=1299340 RepID=UPI0039EBDF1D
MLNKLNQAYSELQNLVNGHRYSIDQINWWLLKYGDLYKDVSKNNNKLCQICLEGSEENLPYDCIRKPDYCTKRPELGLFINFWEELDKATQLHKLEKKCQRAFDEYCNLICLDEELRNWVVKHYHIFYQIGAYFSAYMEFNTNGDKSFHVVEAPDLSFGVTVREDDFNSSIKFYDVYHDLYYNQKLYPEKIKEWDELFAKIQFPKNDL